MVRQGSDSASSNEETPYEIFVSYAREDDRTGWVSEIVGLIENQPEPGGGPPPRVFFDRSEIRGDQDWRHRILGALRRSKVLLIFLSPAFHQSPYCQWEWNAFQAARSLRKLQGQESTSVVRFVQVPGSEGREETDWIQEVRRQNYLLDLAHWFGQSDGLPAWRSTEREQAAQQISERLWRRISDERAGQRAFGNLRGSNRHFVGRIKPMRELHEALCLSRIGMVSAVHGLGGIGKTELAVQYAYEHAWSYTGGIWQLNAEGHQELLPLVASLAGNSHFLAAYGPRFTETEQADARLLGRAVLDLLARHARNQREAEQQALLAAGCGGSNGGGCAVLLILDNVDQRELLATHQLQHLPELAQAGDLLRVVATTRLGADQWPADRIHVQTLRALSDAEARELFHQLRRSQPYPDPDYEAGVERLIAQLGGYTLAVEQVAAYLGLNPVVSPHKLADGLSARGLQLADGLQASDPRVRNELHHQQALVRAVLEETLGALTELERHMLALAAHLPPDHIRWDWLAGMLAPLAPEALQHEDFEPPPLDRARERLVAAQLLNTTDDGDIAWMHRVVGAHVRELLGEVAGQEAKAVCMAWISNTATFLEKEFDRYPVRPWALLRALTAVSDDWLNSSGHSAEQARVILIAANLVTSHGSTPQATRLALSSLATFRRLAQEQGEARQARHDLSAALFHSASLLQRRGAPGDAEQAWSMLQESQTILRLLATGNEGDARAPRDLAATLNHMASFLLRRGGQGDAEQAWAQLEESLAISRALAQANSESIQTLRILAISLETTAHFLQRNDSSENAEQAWGILQEKLSIHRRLVQADPGNVQSQRDLAVSLDHAARFLLRFQAKDEAQAEQAWAFRGESLSILRRLIHDNREDEGAQRDLAVLLGETANALLRRGAQGDTDRAWPLLQESRAIHLQRLQANPEDAETLDDLAVSLEQMAAATAQRGSVAKAIPLLEQAISVREQLLSRNASRWQAERLANSLKQLGATLLSVEPDKSTEARLAPISARVLELCGQLLLTGPLPADLAQLFEGLSQGEHDAPAEP